METGIDDAELIRRLSKTAHGFSWFVTSKANLAAKHLDWVRSLQGNDDFEDFVRRHYFFETESKPTELFRFLKSRYPVREQDGFLFFDLAKP